MTKRAYPIGVGRLQTLLNTGAVGGLTDAELLERFVSREGEAAESAFAALVDRHGGVVLRACRARVRDEHAAQDAFQATFLVLSRRAGSLRVRDSIGPWLHSVAWRVASSVRSGEDRRRRHERQAAEMGGRCVDPVCYDDSERVLHEEVDRLPERYRKPVVLCGLSGLTTEQAARQLNWPVGTVRSRLARGRDRLRDRLTRRGLAPSAGLVVMFAAEEGVRAAVPAATASATIRIAMHAAAGRGFAAAAPEAVVSMAKSTLGSMLMTRSILASAACFTLAVSTCATAVVLSRGGDEGKPAPTPSSAALAQDRQDPPKPVVPSPDPANSIADRFEAIKAEHRAENEALWAAQAKAADQRERNELYKTMSPDEAAYCRRMIDLAATAPNDPVARDALLWVVDHPGYSDLGAYGDEFARAAARLVRDHGDDPDAVRIGLQLDNVLTFHRDHLLVGFLASAKGREAKGLARLALGRYLQRKSSDARFARLAGQRRPTLVQVGVIGEDGKPHDVKKPMPDEQYAYELHLKQCDPEFLQAEAERLFEEVIEDYGDVRYVTHWIREMEAVLKQPKPERNGKTLSENELRKLRKIVESTSTLGKFAKAHLYEMHALEVGMPAPEIDGVDFEGKPLRLSDYRGKVVAIAFWGSWCGPCVREIPRERDLVEKYEGRPFAMLGVDCRDTKENAARVMERERVAWPNWHDGEDGGGPIARRYRISSYPTVFVIDSNGMIRSKSVSGDSLDELVEKLVAETEAGAGSK